MQTNIHCHGVDFVVEFDVDGEIDAIYIGGVDVTEVLSIITTDSIRCTVQHNAKRWFEEYRQEIADEERAARMLERMAA